MFEMPLATDFFKERSAVTICQSVFLNITTQCQLTTLEPEMPSGVARPGAGKVWCSPDIAYKPTFWHHSWDESIDQTALNIKLLFYLLGRWGNSVTLRYFLLLEVKWHKLSY